MMLLPFYLGADETRMEKGKVRQSRPEAKTSIAHAARSPVDAYSHFHRMHP